MASDEAPSEVAERPVDRVQAWLTTLHVSPAVCTVFLEQKMDGSALTEVTNADLLEMKILAFGTRNKIMKAIRILFPQLPLAPSNAQPPPPPPAQSAGPSSESTTNAKVKRKLTDQDKVKKARSQGDNKPILTIAKQYVLYMF